MSKLRKGKAMLLKKKTKVKVVHDTGSGVVFVNIGGAYRVVNKSNLRNK